MTKQPVLPSRSRRQRKAMPTEAPKVYSYTRVSTDRQASEGVSIEEQTRRIEGRALEQGWTIARQFSDVGVSGSVPLGERPQGSELLATVLPGDIVLAAKLDRMFRSARDALDVIEAFHHRKISLWLLDLGGDVSGNGIAKLMLTVLSAFAEFERDRIGERIRDAKRHRRRENRHLGGVRPFGYEIAARKPGVKGAPDLIPIPAEQDAIATMKSMRQADHTLREIAAKIQEQGFAISYEGVRRVLARAELADAENGEAA